MRSNRAECIPVRRCLIREVCVHHFRVYGLGGYRFRRRRLYVYVLVCDCYVTYPGGQARTWASLRLRTSAQTSSCCGTAMFLLIITSVGGTANPVAFQVTPEERSTSRVEAAGVGGPSVLIPVGNINGQDSYDKLVQDAGRVSASDTWGCLRLFLDQMFWELRRRRGGASRFVRSQRHAGESHSANCLYLPLFLSTIAERLRRDSTGEPCFFTYRCSLTTPRRSLRNNCTKGPPHMTSQRSC
jgi:hypothetical protein